MNTSLLSRQHSGQQGSVTAGVHHQPGCPPLVAAEQRETTASFSCSFFTITVVLQTADNPAKLPFLTSNGPQINMGGAHFTRTHTLHPQDVNPLPATRAGSQESHDGGESRLEGSGWDPARGASASGVSAGQGWWRCAGQASPPCFLGASRHQESIIPSSRTDQHTHIRTEAHKTESVPGFLLRTRIISSRGGLQAHHQMKQL